MIYSLKIMVSSDRNTIAIEHKPVTIETISSDSEVTEKELDMVASAFQQQLYQLLKCLTKI